MWLYIRISFGTIKHEYEYGVGTYIDTDTR